MCKYSQFGHTIFMVRLASLPEEDAQSGQPFPSAQRLTVGINSQGLTVFEPQSKAVRESFTFNGEDANCPNLKFFAVCACVVWISEYMPVSQLLIYGALLGAEIAAWKPERTSVVVTLQDANWTATQRISLQAVPSACAEIAALLADYDAVFPKRRKGKRELVTAKKK